MFRPNQMGELYRFTGRDIYARATYSDSIQCPFAVIRLPHLAQKTDKRADSSASRGSADEIILKHGRILVPKFVTLLIDDVFAYRGQRYLVAGVEPRVSVAGELDHFEVNLEALPQ